MTVAPRIAIRQREGVASTASVRFASLIVFVYVVVTATAPYLYGTYLAPLLLLALAGLLVAGERVPIVAAGWVAVLGTLGVLACLWGYARRNPGVWAVTSVFIYEPIVLGLIFSILYSEAKSLKWLTRSLDTALVCVLILGFLVYVSKSSGFVLPTWLVDPRFTATSDTTENLRTNYQGFNSLVFLTPYALVRAFTSGSGDLRLVRRIVLLAAGLSGVILSGRRIMFLTTPIAICAALVVVMASTRSGEVKKSFGKALLAIAGGTIGVVLVLRTLGTTLWSGLTQTISSSNFFNSDDIRILESQVMLHEWASSPVIGFGAGAVIPGFSRNDTSPWTFELSYHEVLLDTGIVGMVILTAWGVWTALRLVQGIRNHVNIAAPALAGFLGSVLASSTDPYLFKLDGMWMVFIPFGIAVGIRQRMSERLAPRP